MRDEAPCSARYHLNNAVKCWVTGEHSQHEGMYLLAGQCVSWTDDDKRPEPPAAAPAKTSMQEAFERAGAS